MKVQIIKLISRRDYKVWCNGRLAVVRDLDNRSVFRKNTKDVNRYLKSGQDKLIGIKFMAS